MNLCRDCKHARKGIFQRWRNSVCKRSDHGPLNPMDGKPQYQFDEPCELMRMNGGDCGLEGKLFEPKE